VATAFGARLIVVCSAVDFDQLIKEAEDYVELPRIDDLSEGPDRELSDRELSDRASSDRAYAGAYIARHSQMLFAIRNHTPDEQREVVDQVVRFKLEGVPEPYAPPRSPLDMWESGPVHNIATEKKAGHARVVYPTGYEDEKAAETAFYNIYRRIDLFNRDCDRLASKLKDRIEDSKDDLFCGPEVEQLTAELRLTRKYFGLADALALHFQLRTRRTLLALLALTFMVALVLKVSPLLPRYKLLLDCFYLLWLMAAFGLYYAARRGEYQNKYQYYRALAEGLRVRFFLGLAGLKDSVADRYLIRELGLEALAENGAWVFLHRQRPIDTPRPK